jgi:hypothetical protein
MHRVLALGATLALAACGGGGGGAVAPPPVTPTNSPAPQQLVTPQFTIVITQSGSSNSRSPQFVSTATASITITLTSVGGNPPSVSPTSVTTNITGSTCPCTVSGPASPAGQSDAYSLITYDAAGGTGNALDQGSVTFTPTEGAPNPQNVVLMGIPYTVAITGTPTTWHANTSGQTANLTVTVKDHSGQTITGTYANQVVITDPDTQLTNGTKLTGTNVDGSCVSDSCVDMKTSTDTATLNYGGLAENPVVLASSGTGLGTAGTATFTPLLNAITSDGANPTSSLGGVGIDLYTSLSTSTVGYSGTVSYKELGFTNSPYNIQLSTTGGSSCSAFATLSTGANASNETPFTATAISTPVAGTCTLTVTDSLTDQPNTLPTFVADYTTGQVNVNSKVRR